MDSPAQAQQHAARTKALLQALKDIGVPHLPKLYEWAGLVAL
jgi:hypothetical protein